MFVGRRAECRFERTLRACLVLTACAAMCMIGLFGWRADKAVADDDTRYAIPQDATSMWIDVESPDVTVDSVDCKLMGKPVDFSKTASGITAIGDVTGTRGEEASLVLSSKSGSPVRARLAVTLATSDDKVIGEYNTSLILSGKPSTVVPGFVPAASFGSSAAAAGNGISRLLSGSGHLSATGVAVAGVAVAAVVAFLVALVLRYAKRMSSSVNARHGRSI